MYYIGIIYAINLIFNFYVLKPVKLIYIIHFFNYIIN